MNPDLAKVNIQFLGRITLQPQEIPAFNAVIEELQQYLPQPEMPMGAPPVNGEHYADNSGSGVQGSNAGDHAQEH